MWGKKGTQIVAKRWYDGCLDCTAKTRNDAVCTCVAARARMQAFAAAAAVPTIVDRLSLLRRGTGVYTAASAGAAAARGDGAAHGEAAPSARSSSTV